MTSKPAVQALFLGAGHEMQCGVGHFTRLLGENVAKLGTNAATTLTLTRSEGTTSDIWQAVGSARNVVCNFPIVAWKRVIFRPLLVMAMARLRRRHVVLIQHEWAGLNWLRRMTYIPALLLANTIVMFSPLVRRQLVNDTWVGWTAKKVMLAPLPPNIEAPAAIADSQLRQTLTTARQNGRIVVGHFGSIYPGKQPNALLNMCAILRARGLKPLLVYVGSFIRATDNVEEDFRTRADELGITDDVIVSGYVESDSEVFGIFSEIDVFCYPLSEGITARRASILTCVQSGRPVVVTGPAEPDEFNHHPRFKALIDRGAIALVPPGSGEDAYVDKIVALLKDQPPAAPFEFDGWWRDAIAAIRAQFTP